VTGGLTTKFLSCAKIVIIKQGKGLFDKEQQQQQQQQSDGYQPRATNAL
jgi:hypothetical protein